MSDDGVQPQETAEKSLGEIVGEVSQKASLLVREEIELAKVEVGEKAKSIGKGVGAGVFAGVLLFFFLIFLMHTLAFLLADVFDLKVWVGYGIVTLGLLVLAAIGGLLALRFVKKGAPPTPDLAIEEAKETRATIEKATS
jgi:uncharacterized membrane protein YqjE